MPEVEAVAVTVTLNQRDYAEALRAFASTNAALAKRILFWVAIALLAYMLFTLNLTSAQWPYAVAFVLGAVALLEALTKYAIPYWGARSFVRKNAEKLGPALHEISPDGVNYRGIHGEGKTAWSGFHQIRETKRFFLLYTQSNFAQIVPKKCFASPAEIDIYRGIIRKYYKGKMSLLE